MRRWIRCLSMRAAAAQWEENCWARAAADSFCCLSRPKRQARIKKQFNRLIQVPFEFEFGGSQIIFFDREEDFAKHDRARSRRRIQPFRELNLRAPLASV